MPAESASLADRRALADDLAAECERIAHENALLEAHLARVSPTDGAAPPEDPEDDDALRAKRPAGGAKKKSRASAAPDVRPRALTVLERHAVVNAELEAIEHELARARADGERKLDNLRARVEETDARIADAKRETFEFKRDVAVGAVDPRVGAVDAPSRGTFAPPLRREPTPPKSTSSRTPPRAPGIENWRRPCAPRRKPARISARSTSSG